MSESSETSQNNFWEEDHPVNTRQERLLLFEKLVHTLQNLIGGREPDVGATLAPITPQFPDKATIKDIIKYYDAIKEPKIAFRLSEDYLTNRETDTEALKMYVAHLTAQRNAKKPEAMVRKLIKAERLLTAANFSDNESAIRDDLILDIKLSIAEHLPHINDKINEICNAIQLADTYLTNHAESQNHFLWQKANLYSKLASLQRSIDSKVEYYLKSMHMLHLLNESDKDTDFTYIILFNFEELLSISQTDDECKSMIEIIERIFTSFIDDTKAPTPYLLHNLSWLYYKKALVTKYDAERDFYLTKSEHFLTRKDRLTACNANSDNLRAHIANLKADNEHTEIKKLHYLYDCIELYTKAMEGAPHITAIHAYIAGAYLKLAQEENDIFKRINLVTEAIKKALISSRVGINISDSYKVLAKAYKILEDNHSDSRQKELYHMKKLQYEELLH